MASLAGANQPPTSRDSGRYNIQLIITCPPGPFISILTTAAAVELFRGYLVTIAIYAKKLSHAACSSVNPELHSFCSFKKVIYQI